MKNVEIKKISDEELNAVNGGVFESCKENEADVVYKFEVGDRVVFKLGIIKLNGVITKRVTGPVEWGVGNILYRPYYFVEYDSFIISNQWETEEDLILA